jgi:hypothetical protein
LGRRLLDGRQDSFTHSISRNTRLVLVVKNILEAFAGCTYRWFVRLGDGGVTHTRDATWVLPSVEVLGLPIALA